MDTISRIGVVGLGTIGVQELALWQRAGLRPVGYDVSEARVRSLRSAHTSDVVLTTRIADLEAADALVLCLPNIAPTGENSMAAFHHFVDAMQALRERD